MTHLRRWVSVAFAALCFFSTITSATEYGMGLGGEIKVKDSDDFFKLTFYSDYESGFSEHVNWLMPITFGFADGLFLLRYTPSLQYKIALVDKLELRPTAGVSLTYGNAEVASETFHSFGMGLGMMLQLFYQATERLSLRFSPIGFELTPWRYTNNGVGSDATVALGWNLFFGLGYQF